MNVKVTTLRSL